MTRFDTELPAHPHLRYGKLENGLTYYVLQNQRPENRAELRLVVRAGSVLEDDDQQGLAHIVEHMAFNGTKRFGARELVNYFERIGMRFGAHLNAQTGLDDTIYKLQIPMDDPEILTTAFWILRDWAADLLFLPEEIERERKVGLEEWRQGRGATTRVREKLFPYFFHGSKYPDRLPIGTEESLRNFTHEALIRFYKDWYRPDLMSVMMVGDFDSDEMVKQIELNFGDLSNSESPRVRPVEELGWHEETFFASVFDEEIPHSSIAILEKVKEGPIRNTSDYRKALLKDLSVRIMNERLQNKAQQPKAPFLGARAGVQALCPTVSGNVISAVAAPKDLKRALVSMLVEIRTMQEYGISSAELKRAKLRYMANVDAMYEERNKTPSRQLIKEMISHFTSEEPFLGIEHERILSAAILPSLSKEEIEDGLKNWFVSSAKVVHLVSGEIKDMNVEQLKEWNEEGLDVVLEEPNFEDKQKPLLSKLPQNGSIVSRKEWPELDLREWKLSNGNTIWIKQTDFQSDRIHLNAIAPGGLRAASMDEYCSAFASNAIAWFSGLGDHDLQGLMNVLAGKKVQIHPYFQSGHHGFEGVCTSEDLETMLQLVFLYQNQSRFTEQGFLRDQDQRIEQVRRAQIDLNMRYQDQFRRLYWQDHPRHRPWSLKEVSHINLEKAETFFKRMYARSFHFVFVGNIDLNEDKILRYLGSTATLPKIDPSHHGESLLQGIHTDVMHLGSEEVAQIQMRFVSRVQTDMRERIAASIFGTVLKHRLRKKLREERGDTYSVHFYGMDGLYPEPHFYYTLHFGCDPLKVEELRQLVLSIFQEALQAPPQINELEIVRQQLLRAHEVNLKENESWVAQLQNALKREKSPMRILEYPKYVQEIMCEDVFNAGVKCLSLDNRLELIWLPQTD
ncbi:MAG: hypothetical protein CMK59_06395 [Proteobacteria bacterium]|nr:hypothetical protein [Pseudomonadota bacterium]